MQKTLLAEGVTAARARIRTPIAVYKNEETEAANFIAVNFPDKYYFSDKDNILLEGSLNFMNESAEENKRKVLVTDNLHKVLIFTQTTSLHLLHARQTAEQTAAL